MPSASATYPNERHEVRLGFRVYGSPIRSSSGGSPPVNTVPPSISGAGLPEITTFDFTGSDGGEYETIQTILISREDARVQLWFNPFSGSVSEPGLPDGVDVNLAVDLPEWIDPETPLTAEEVATAFAAGVNGQGWSATALGTVVTVTDAESGTRVDAVNNATAALVVSVTQQGSESLLVGQTLTRTEGTWTDADTITGIWQHDQGTGTWVDIAGETAATYEVQSIYATEDIRYYETATNGAGSTSEPSNELGPVLGLALWQDASRITGLSVADPVATWEDVSGNGNDATQATSGSRPTYRDDDFPTVRFDGSDDILNLTSNLSLPAECTVIAVFNRTGRDGSYCTIVAAGGGDNSFIAASNSNTDKIAAYDTGARNSDEASSASFCSAVFRRDASFGWDFWVNGASAGSVAGAAGTVFVSSHIGSDQFANLHQGDIAEVRVFGMALSDLHVAQEMSRAAALYGLPDGNLAEFNFSDPEVSKLGYPFHSGGFYQFSGTGDSIGGAYAFRFFGKSCYLVLQSAGTAQPMNLTIDGVSQAYADLPVGVFGDVLIFSDDEDSWHDVVIVPTENAWWLDVDGIKVRAVGTPLLDFATGYGRTYQVDDANDVFLDAEVRPFEDSGAGQAYFRLADESMSFRATCSKLTFALWTGGIQKFSLWVDGAFIEQAVTASSSLINLIEFDGLDGDNEHEYQIIQDKTNVTVYSVMVDSDGSFNTLAPVSHRPIVFFMGDSNTQAADFLDAVALGDSSDGFAALSCRPEGYAVANYGVGGNKVADMVARFATNIAALIRDAVEIVMFSPGTNDAGALGPPTDIEDFEDDCVDLLNAALAVPDVPIRVCNIIYGSDAGNDATIDLYRAKWVAAVATVADARITLYDPTSWLLRTDYSGVHLNLSGHTKVAAEIADILGT